MAVTGKLSSHTEAYWRTEYQVSQADIDLVTGVILQEGLPVPVAQLAAAVIEDKQSREKALAAQLARQTQVYRPMDSYEVGQRLVFSELDLAEGEVVGQRPGKNVRYGEFQVIRVAMASDGRIREFAASMPGPHHLNRPVEELVITADEGLTGTEAIEAFTPLVVDRLNVALSADEDMVFFDDKWFLRELLPEINLGYLNLAEAAIYEAAVPLTAREILDRLSLTSAGSEAAQLFALHRALENDGRFDDLGGDGERRWFLRALEPEAIWKTPTVLADPIMAKAGEPVGVTLLDVIEELGDDLDELPGTARASSSTLSFVLGFPHLYAGTMPAPARLVALVPDEAADHYPITVTDRRRRKAYVAWVVPSKGFVCGLKELYQAANMTVGAQLTITAGDAPLSLDLEYAAPRSRRNEWLRTANAQEGRLVLEMKPTTLSVRCDENAVIISEDMDAIAGLMAVPAVRSAPIGDVVRRAFLELAKLSGQGLVHVKALYMAVNMHRRCGAAPILAHLTRQAAYDPMGEGLWAYDGSLEGQTYESVDDMRERPLSNRSDRLRDQAVPYQGI
ncbi:MAG: hypothetical protein GXY68_04335 [Chloroflexi bacterium]|jgi:hypothetical protein|nr:hypothetical protein [Chloroflexota bacterium]